MDFCEELLTVLRGDEISDYESQLLEAQLLHKPADSDTRMKLLGYYSCRWLTDGDCRLGAVRHLIWFIANEPRHRFLQIPMCCELYMLDRTLYAQCKACWLKQLELFGDDVKVLENAAACLRLEPISMELINRAACLEPDEQKWGALLEQYSEYRNLYH